MKKLIFFVFFVLLSFAGFSQSKKISALPTAVNLNSSFVPIIQDSSGSYVNRKFPGNSFRTPLASNGLHLDSDTVKLGGTLTENTSITGGNDLRFYMALDNTDLSRESFLYVDQSIGTTTPWVIGSYKNIGAIETSLYTPNNNLELIAYARGANIRMLTDTAGGAGVERLKIDSVGNVSFPNTNDFNVNQPNSYLTIEADNRRFLYQNLFTSGSFNAMTVDTSGFIWEGNTMTLYNDDLPNQHASNLHLDNYGVNIVAKGRTFYIKTDTAGSIAPLGGIERLKIDSVGNVRMDNTESLNITSTSADFLTLNPTNFSFGISENTRTSSISGDTTMMNLYIGTASGTSQTNYYGGVINELVANDENKIFSAKTTSLNYSDYSLVASTIDNDTTAAINISVSDGTMPVSVLSALAAGSVGYVNVFPDSIQVVGKFSLDKDINTAASDSGNYDNISSGRFRKDTSGSTFTINSNRINPDAIIILTPANAAIDATATIWTVSAGAGTATITFNAPPTSNFNMNFLILN